MEILPLRLWLMKLLVRFPHRATLDRKYGRRLEWPASLEICFCSGSQDDEDSLRSVSTFISSSLSSMSLTWLSLLLISIHSSKSDPVESSDSSDDKLKFEAEACIPPIATNLSNLARISLLSYGGAGFSACSCGI